MIIHGDAKAICAAYVKARGDMSATVIKDAKGNFGKYATLAAIVEATTPHLAKHALAVVQEASTDEMGIVIETWLVHESGATMQFTPLPLPLTDRRPQAVGSALTYGRRYALASIFGLAPDDDDGQAAQDAQQAPQRAQATPTDKPKATPAQLEEIERLGSIVYPTEWETNKSRLADFISKGMRTQLEDLYEVEAASAILSLNKKIQPVAH